MQIGKNCHVQKESCRSKIMSSTKDSTKALSIDLFLRTGLVVGLFEVLFLIVLGLIASSW